MGENSLTIVTTVKDYINGSNYYIFNVDAKNLCLVRLNALILTLVPNPFRYELEIGGDPIYCLNGDRLSIKNDSDCMMFVKDSDVDDTGLFILFVEFVIVPPKRFSIGDGEVFEVVYEGKYLMSVKASFSNVVNVLLDWDDVHNGYHCSWNMSNLNLGGEISPSIGDLRNLHSIDLKGNHLTEQIPDEIGNCGDLRTLDLSGNLLYGDIPFSISKLKQLEEFGWIKVLGMEKLKAELQARGIEMRGYFARASCQALPAQDYSFGDAA
ncbi:hypothetical protein IFM89_018512 [Coptis chinensis]|uniref:Uncharacterized protein n=1 Tax=Coptis chinensis TaxID=261450 RepID=A0A835M6R5_9MAGN|nr:hypothetical protein IFM89_018512 [Coptis chinensis]